MRIRRGVIGAVMLLLASAVQTFAIEGLQLSLQCSNVVLSWPSVEGDTFIVQYRPTLDVGAPWQTLTSSLPADVGANLTFFTHSNVVQHPNCGGSGGSFAAMAGGGNDSMSLNDSGLGVPLAKRADGTSAPVPIAIYPPGFDLTGFLIFDPATAEWVAGSEYSRLEYSISGLSSAGPQLDGPEPQGGGGSGGGGTNSAPEPETGFYQVVKVGVHLYGITNGMVLSGQVQLPVEFSNADDTNGVPDNLSLTDTDTESLVLGVDGPAFPLDPTNRLNMAWDTLQFTNGTYTLQLAATLDDGMLYEDHPVTVTISNLAYFPDPLNVGGYGIYVGLKTVYTDGTGTWHLKVYDDQNTYLGFLDGPIDTNGYFAYPGIPGPGFTLNNTDGQGNINPSTSYTLVYSTDAAHPISKIPPFIDLPLTNKVFIEPNWNFQPTTATVIYQDVFPTLIGNGATEEMEMMNAICQAEEGPGGHALTLGSPNAPFCLGVNGSWLGAVLPAMMGPQCRDFIYFGHGSANLIGYGDATAMGQTLISEAAVAAVLTNNAANSLKGPNMHPYRFVFLCGCDTAKGNWPLAFGIPKQENMFSNDFIDKRGLRPRAFLGWGRKKQYTYFDHSFMNDDFLHFLLQFWQSFADVDSDGVPTHILSTAIRDGKLGNTGGEGLRVYGAQDIDIQL